MLKITAEEVNFIIYQFLHESGKYLRQYTMINFGFVLFENLSELDDINPTFLRKRSVLRRHLYTKF